MYLPLHKWTKPFLLKCIVFPLPTLGGKFLSLGGNFELARGQLCPLRDLIVALPDTAGEVRGSPQNLLKFLLKPRNQLISVGNHPVRDRIFDHIFRVFPRSRDVAFACTAREMVLNARNQLKQSLESISRR